MQAPVFTDRGFFILGTINPFHMPQDTRLFLLDAYALIYRAYYAFIRNPIRNSKGVNTSAVYGFTNALVDLLDREEPTHLAVVFDAPGETDRAVEHAFYKANREEMPEDIRLSIPVIREILKAFNIPMLELEGYEADDIIGTIAKQKEQDGHTVYMVTPDKDFAQLVSPNIYMYKPSRKGNGVEILGEDEVKAAWGVERPEQVIDILGLWGDSVDNIPGIPGIGEKTAKKLVAQYGSVEGLIDHVDELTGKRKENVTEFAEQGLISKQLATIILDAPIEVDDADLEISQPDHDALAELFAELEFRTLGRRILGDDFNVNRTTEVGDQMDLFQTGQDRPATAEKGKRFETTDTDYRLLSTTDAIDACIESIRSAGAFAFDTETTGLDVLSDELVGLSISCAAGTGAYLPVPAGRNAAIQTLQPFKAVFEDSSIEKVAQNLKFDWHILSRYGIELRGPVYDTMLAHYLMHPDLRHNMDYLSESYLGYTPVPIEDLIGKKGKNQKSMRDVPVEKVVDYAAEDADVTWQLAEHFKQETGETYVQTVLDRVELPLVPVLLRMEQEGIALDVDFLSDYGKTLNEEMVRERDAVFEMAGVEFNLNSPKQLGEVLFDRMEIPYKGKKTKTGQYSTNEAKLQTLAGDHAIVRHILEYREIAKLRSTYVDALPRLINARTGRLHTRFEQAVAATGRLSSQNPNLQNIPIRTERGRRIRRAFIPRSDQYTLMAADYSQIELRLVAHMSEDEAMLEAFQNGQDIHATTAARVFDVALDDVDRTMRSHAKTVNFGIIYGVSAYGLSQQTELSTGESKEIIETYFKTYPGIKAYMDRNIEFARQNGYVETILGRRRYLRDIDSRNHTLRSHAERNAINAPVQGSAADLIKLAMIDIHRAMIDRSMKSKLLLQVHDELVFDAHRDELDDLTTLVREKMENALDDLTVPILAEVGTGANWLEAH